MECIAIASSGASSTISKMQLERNFVMEGDKRIFAEAGEAVNVFHYPRWTMEDLEETSKKLLGPTSDLMDRTVALQDLLDGDAVARPEELGAPQKFPILANCPSAASSFTDKRMTVAFLQLRKPKRMGCKWAPFMVRSKLQMPSERRRARAALDASELSGWISIQPTPVLAQSVLRKQGREESCRARQGEEVAASFSSSQRWVRGSPHFRGNGFPMMTTLEGTERLHANFEERTINVAEREKTDEGAQCCRDSFLWSQRSPICQTSSNQCHCRDR